MKAKIDLKWLKGMAFESEINGHKIILDANEEFGGKDKGPRPKPLMLLALAGCTGMDVVSILKKMKIELDDFSVEVEANMTETHPKHYNEMKVIYKFWGKELPMKKIKQAVKLSDNNYCGVSAVYKKAIKVTNEIKINPEK